MLNRIITIHCIPNFGSILQTYALAKFLNSNGHRVEVIDYRPSYYFKGRNLLRKIYPIIFHPFEYYGQIKKVDSFCKKYIPMSSTTYTTYEELCKIQDKGEVYIAGGDQLWNSFHPCGKDDSYKLTFTTSHKKIAYGTSMGRTSFRETELQNLSNKIRDFAFVGLREQSTVPMLQAYTQVPVTHVADPVLLLEENDYKNFVGSERLIKEPYMLVYMAAKSELLEAAVEKISSERGLKIVHVSGFSKKCRCDYKLTTGPEELLNLIYNADFVLSASFHATLFSVLFNKQFCTLLPEAGTNVRIEDALDYLNLGSRIIHDTKELPAIDEIISYDEVNIKKDILALNSRNLLLNELKKINSI